MSPKTIAAIVAVAAVLVVGLTLLFVVSGDGDSFTVEDEAGDVLVTLTSGEDDLDTSGEADVVLVRVEPEGNAIVFEARFAHPVPELTEKEGLELRWDVAENGIGTWIVTADLDAGLNASILSQQTDFGASTIDETLPGRVQRGEDFVRIELDVDRIEGFPSEFEWTFQSSFDGDRTDPSSARADDRVPDEGSVLFSR